MRNDLDLYSWPWPLTFLKMVSCDSQYLIPYMCILTLSLFHLSQGLILNYLKNEKAFWKLDSMTFDPGYHGNAPLLKLSSTLTMNYTHVPNFWWKPKFSSWWGEQSHWNRPFSVVGCWTINEIEFSRSFIICTYRISCLFQLAK